MAGSGSIPPPDKEAPSASPSPARSTDQPLLVWIAEDNPGDAFLIRTAINRLPQRTDCRFLRDGVETIDAIDNIEHNPEARCPDILMLDINMPRKTGTDVLTHLHHTARCRSTKVIVVSTSDSPKDRDRLIALGAAAYFAKPASYADFMTLTDLVRTVVAH